MDKEGGALTFIAPKKLTQFYKRRAEGKYDENDKRQTSTIVTYFLFDQQQYLFNIINSNLW